MFWLLNTPLTVCLVIQSPERLFQISPGPRIFCPISLLPTSLNIANQLVFGKQRGGLWRQGNEETAGHAGSW